MLVHNCQLLWLCISSPVGDNSGFESAHTENKRRSPES